MDELILEKFEEASEVVQRVCTVNIFQLRRETECILSQRTCSIQELIRFGEHFIKSAL